MPYNTAITDALSAVANSNAPSLKFATWFGTGVSLGSITEITPGINYQQNITGTDALTGCIFPDSLQSFMGSNVQTYIQMIPDPTTPAWTAGTVTTQIENILQSTDCPQSPTGARELYQPVHSRVAAIGGGSSKPQIDFHITRPGSGGAPAPELSEIYVSMWHYIPPELDSMLDYAAAANYYTLWDWKTGGYGGNTGYGDYRVSLLVYRGSVGGGLQYKLSGDNGANGNWDGSTTIPTVGTSNIGSGGYWQIKSAPGSANADLGYWVRIHLYIKRPVLSYARGSSTESGARDPMYTQDTTTGITFCAVENPTTGRFLVVGSKVGGRQSGCENLPFTRMMNSLCYCTASDGVDPIVYAKATGLQIWDKPSIYLPITVSKRSQAPLYWPLRGSLALQNGSGSPTFTRATAAWDFNHIGKLVSIPSGAVRMRGYRPVINSIASSEGAFSGVARASSSTGNIDTPAGKGCATSTKLVEDTTASSTHWGNRIINVVTLGTYKIRQYFKAAGRTMVNIYGSGSFPFPSGASATIDLSTGAITGSAAAHVSSTLLSDGWVEIISTHSPTATGSHLLYTSLLSGGSATYSGDGTSGVLNTGVMAVNITPNSLTTVPEYVSVGVLSSPWHGAGADGVKYFSTYEDGTPIPEANLLGARLNPNSVTNNILYCRDLTNAAWVKTNVTAALTQTGIDGQSNACSLVEFTADGGTVLQTITAAAAAGCSGFYVKRHTGSGTIEFTRDNVNWTDITSQINASDFSLVKIENTSVTNPVIGFRGQNGNKIIVDAGINHLGTQISETPIITTSAAVTVNADVPTAPTSGNFSDTAGTIIATVTRDDWTAGNGSAVGSSTRGLYTSSTNSGAQGLDGTNTVNGPTGTPSDSMKIGLRWSGTSLQVYSNGSLGNAGSYDGGFNLSSIALAAGVQCTIKDVAIWHTSLSDTEMIAAANNI